MEPLGTHVSGAIFAGANGDFITQEIRDKNRILGSLGINKVIPAFTNRIGDGNAVLIL
jgi:hypothetical protein